MVQVKRTYKTIVPCFAGYYGAVQAALWVIASFLCILCHVDVIHNHIGADVVTAFPLLETLRHIYYLFLLDSGHYLGNPTYDVIIRPKAFFAFMMVYIILSFAWMCDSIMIILYWHRKNGKANRVLYAVWSGLALVCSLVDLILFSCLLSDQSYMLTNEPELIEYPINHFFLWAYMTVIHLVMRGYIIWVINIILSAFLIYINVQCSKTPTPDAAVSRDIIYGFGSPANTTNAANNPASGSTFMNSLAQPRTPTNSGNSPSRQDRNTDDSNRGILRNNSNNISFIRQTNINPNYRNTRTVNPTYYENGRPWIPPPDYTPPNSPTPFSRSMKYY